MSVELRIDPSYKGTALALFDFSKKNLKLALFGVNESKKSLINYYNASVLIKEQVSEYLQTNLKEFTVSYLEAPTPRGLSAAGLYGLQYHLLDVLLTHPLIVSQHSIATSFIHGRVKKLGDDSISFHKNLCKDRIIELEHQGWVVENSSLLKKPGDDIATVVLFEKLSTELNRKKNQINAWPEIQLRG